MTQEELISTKVASSTNVTEAYFAPGSAADHPHGLLYQGDYQHEADGTAIAIRLHARALHAQGVPMLLKPFSGVVLSPRGVYEPLHVAGIPERVQEEVGDLPRTSISQLFPLIRHMVVHKTEDISNRLMRGAVGSLESPELLLKARQAIYGNSVLYSVWERDRISHVMARELRRLGDNWVPCEQNAQMLRKSGVDNVFVVPHPYDPASPLVLLTRRKPYPDKRFYFIGRWEPRKNPVKILRAFAEAFSPGEPAKLTMKFHGNWADYPTFEETVGAICREGKWTKAQLLDHVTDIRGILRPDQIVKLHFDNNIYLAPSSGEAWCLPAFEAKLAGNLVIHTPYGGTADFCEDRDLALPFSMEEVPPSYGWSVGSQWACIDEHHLAGLIKQLQLPGEFVRSQSFQERFSLQSVGTLMLSRLRAVYGGRIHW